MLEEDDSENNSKIELKENLYIFLLELKGELTKKNIRINNDQLQELINTTKSSTILNYIKELVYMLINIKIPNNKGENKKSNKINKDDELSQLESYIQKLESDIRYLLQKEFQNKIKRDAMEMKLNAYMEMENEFEELKEKVKYEGGKFLNNERKDNEIIILRQENSKLKKEIEKFQENNKLYFNKLKSEQETIQNFKKQINLLNKKISNIEKENINQPNMNNSSINININNNGSSSSKWIIKQENPEFSNFNKNINNNSTTGSNFALKKRRINNFTKNFTKYSSNNSNKNSNCNLQIRTKLVRYDAYRGYSGFQTKNNKINNKLMNTIDNNNACITTYSKILNNLCAKNKTPNKKELKNEKKKIKSNSINKFEDYEKNIIENHYISNKGKKHSSNIKNNAYNKIFGFMHYSKFPLSSKNHIAKNSTPSLPKKYLKRDKSTTSHSSLIINKK